ncbi:MAG: NAD(P)-binding protein [candidate division WOR-3 bacterium]|nr:NAD(P)-binding protein [candidate division WOR-3 bacterium]
MINEKGVIIKRAIIIGAGFGGLSSATILAHRGYEVTVIGQNGSPGIGIPMVIISGGFITDKISRLYD